MERAIVDDTEFGRQILSDLEDKFRQLRSSGDVEEIGDGFVRGRITVIFTVAARTKAKPEEVEIETALCCACYMLLNKVVCTGRCCPLVVGPDFLG